MADVGTYAVFPALAGLPPLVRQQRQLEAQIVPLAALVIDEKAIRADIDHLLVTAGISTCTCNGYDVNHVERAGSTRPNWERATVDLIARFSVDPAEAAKLIASWQDTGEPSAWCTVKPSKGAKVRRP